MSNDTDQWHVGKEIPVVLIIAMILQTMGFVWWLATLSSTVSYQTVEITKMNVRLETISASAIGADRTVAINRSDLETLRRDVLELKQRLSSIEALAVERGPQIRELRRQQGMTK